MQIKIIKGKAWARITDKNTRDLIFIYNGGIIKGEWISTHLNHINPTEESAAHFFSRLIAKINGRAA